MFAIDIGLQSVSDARVLSSAIAQALPVLTRDSDDFTNLHNLIRRPVAIIWEYLSFASTTTHATT